MVTLNFKLRDLGAVTLEVTTPTPLTDLLARTAANRVVTFGGYIAIRRKQVITSDTLIADGDTVDIFPALSGG